MCSLFVLFVTGPQKLDLCQCSGLAPQHDWLNSPITTVAGPFMCGQELPCRVGDISSNFNTQFSHSVMSNSSRPHESQHARPPCPWPTPGVHSDSRPSIQWCHPAISSCVVPFSSCPQSLPASDSFPMSQLFTWGGHSTGVSALASFLPKKSQGWSPLFTSYLKLYSKHLISFFFRVFF